jgi:hypothetical protein
LIVLLETLKLWATKFDRDTVDVTPLVISDVQDDSVKRDLSDSAIVADTSIPIHPVDTDADVAVQHNTGYSLCDPGANGVTPEVNGTVPESSTNTDLVYSDVPVSNTARIIVEANVQGVPESSTECDPEISDESDVIVPVIDVQQTSIDATVPESDDVMNQVDESPPCSKPIVHQPGNFRRWRRSGLERPDGRRPGSLSAQNETAQCYQATFPYNFQPLQIHLGKFCNFSGFAPLGQAFDHIGRPNGHLNYSLLNN